MTARNNRTKRLIWVALFGDLAILLGHITAVRGNPVIVPLGRHVLVDGKFGPGEWADARRVVASDSVTLFLKRDQRYLFVALQPSVRAFFSVDLYFDQGSDAPILDLHASAKLGEREGTFGQWPAWVWWNNRGWAANVARAATFEPLEFLADGAKEYQIELGKLRAVRVWLSADVQAGDRTQTIPRNGRNRYGRHWLELRIRDS